MKPVYIILFVLPVVEYSQSWRTVEPKKPVCPPVDCKLNCRPEIGPDGCEVCNCNVSVCSLPKCDPGCEIETVYKGPCPGCKCDKDNGTSGDRKRPPCEPIRCGLNCRQVYKPRGCPICVCEKPECPIPMCSPGCKLKSELIGPCPGCDCSVGNETVEPKKPVCPPVACQLNCRPEIGPDGCEVCKCNVSQCSPPKCDPGCEIETAYEGPCPGCKCDKDVGTNKTVEPKKPVCPPVDCQLNCRPEIGPDGCEVCKCNVSQCSPPKCDPGCEIETVYKGPCPGCKCDTDVGTSGKWKPPICNPIRCGYNCREVYNTRGCRTCNCPKPECPVPMCSRGCTLKAEFIGPCPGCDCSANKGTVEPKKPVCPPVDCQLNCRPEIGPDGCEVCKCNVSQCSPPKCDPGCEIETVYKGPCPGCKCDKDIGTSGSYSSYFRANINRRLLKRSKRDVF